MSTVLAKRLRSSLTADLKDVCRSAGLNASGARLVRYTMNAVWALDRYGLIVRMTADDRRGGNSPQDLVRVARLLQRAEAPIAWLADEIPQPVRTNGWSTTFWRMMLPFPTEQSGNAAAIVEPLRALHEVTLDPDQLPAWDMPSKIEGRLAAVVAAQGAQRRMLEDWAVRSVQTSLRALIHELRGRLDTVRSQLATAEWHLPQGVIHGDAHTGNLVLANDGTALWCDLDSVAFGPREWDLAPAAFGLLRFGRDPGGYRQLVSALGFDVMRDERWPLLRDLRDLQAVTSVLADLPGRPQLADEVARRLRGLLTGAAVVWRRYT